MHRGIYQRNLFVPFLKIITDIIFIELAVLGAYYARFYSVFAWLLPVKESLIPPLKNYYEFSLVIVIIYMVLFAAFHSYDSRFFTTFSQDIPIIFKTCFLGILLAMSVAFLYRGFSFSRIVFLLIFFNTNIFLLVERFFFHYVKRFFLKKGYNILRICLVSSNNNLIKLYEQLKSDKNIHLEIDGYISETPLESLPIPFIGSLETLPECLDAHSCDGLIISLNQDYHYKMADIVQYSEGKNIELFYIPDILDIITSNFRGMEIGGIPILKLKAFTLSGWQGFLKRTFDIVVSSISLVLLSPLFLMVAIIIRIDSKGPIFYKQIRVSLDGNDFTLWKFRSMYVEEEVKDVVSGTADSGGAEFTVKNDPRVTTIGKALRRSSIDELPQLYNVLKGEMSLVGPRPEQRFYVDQYLSSIPHYSERHRVRCGITGWAQVNGLRQQSTSLDERTRYDLYYIEHWSLWFDLKIIIMTFLEVIRGENAY